jgi:outer membrane porin, OprD family
MRASYDRAHLERRKTMTPTRHASLLTLTLLVVVGLASGVAVAEDAPPPPLAPVVERFFPELDEKAKSLPPFFRDADVFLNVRTYYFNRHKPDGTDNEALAVGGWLGFRSGWLLDTFAVGATFYGSAPLHAPDDRDGTLLLKPGQEGYYVPGEAWGALRYKDYARLTGYRQRVDQTYINSQDNRMTPNTFEGVTLGGKIGIVQYLAGYLWNIKQRNSDDFVAMSAAAGVKDEHDGVGLAGVRLTPMKDLKFEVSNQYGENMFNTAYGDLDYLRPLTDDWKIRLGAQFTDQRATGDARVATAEERYWDTQAGGARVQVMYRDLTLTTAFSITGAGNNIQSPWGSFPGYLSLIDQDFNRAGEKAVLVGVAYDFSRTLTQGLSAFSNLAWGWDAINPRTRADAPRQAEYDLTVDYRPPWLKPTFLRGLWFRARAAILDQEDAKDPGYQFRLILNWERDIF